MLATSLYVGVERRSSEEYSGGRWYSTAVVPRRTAARTSAAVAGVLGGFAYPPVGRR